MSGNLKYSIALKNARLDQIASSVGASGLLRIFDGVQPASPDSGVTTQTKLAELSCGAVAFAPPASGGMLSANAIASAAAIASGTASWFRLCKNDGTAVIDGSVGMVESDLIIDDISIGAGQLVGVSSLTITSGN